MASTRLEAGAHAAIIVACLIFAIRSAHSVYSDRSTPEHASAYRSGSRIADTEQLQLHSSPVTLLLLTSSGCHWCTESMPFYRTLVPQAQQAGVRVLGITAEPEAANRRYLASHGLDTFPILSAQANHITVSGTPTLVLVRNNGLVINAWTGKLPDNREREVLSLLPKQQGRLY